MKEMHLNPIKKIKPSRSFMQGPFASRLSLLGAPHLGCAGRGPQTPLEGPGGSPSQPLKLPGAPAGAPGAQRGPFEVIGVYVQPGACVSVHLGCIGSWVSGQLGCTDSCSAYAGPLKTKIE